MIWKTEGAKKVWTNSKVYWKDERKRGRMIAKNREKRDRNERGKKWIKRVDIRRRRIDKLIDVIAARRQLVHGSFHLRSVRRRRRRWLLRPPFRFILFHPLSIVLFLHHRFDGPVFTSRDPIDRTLREEREKERKGEIELDELKREKNSIENERLEEKCMCVRACVRKKDREKELHAMYTYRYYINSHIHGFYLLIAHDGSIFALFFIFPFSYMVSSSNRISDGRSIF